MFPRSIGVITLAITIGAVAGTAAQTTDFSGNWSAAAPAPAPPPAGTPARPPRGDMGSGWGTPLTIRQTATQLIIEHPFFSRYDLQPPLRYVYALDGAESRNTTMAGHATQTRVSRARWDGAALSIVTSYPGIDPATGRPFTTTVTQRLSLASPGELLIETTRGGVLGGRDISTRTVYKKS
jgi:hypothetical protein